MPTASIRFNAVASPNETYAIGATVSLTNNDNTGATTWTWSLLSKPAGSAATIASPSASATSFVADLEGAYLVRLVVNNTLVDEVQNTGVARVLTQHVGLKPHAKDETGEADATEGWVKPWRESYLLMDKRLGLSERRTVRYTGSNTTGPKVLTVTGTFTMPNGDIIPTVDILGAGAGNSAVLLWDGGSLNTNTTVSALAKGLSASVANPDTLAANDNIYLGTGGLIVKTIPALDKVQVLGFCVAAPSTVVLWFEPRPRFNNSTIPVSVTVDTASVPGSTPQFAHADHTHNLVTFSGTPSAIADSAGAAGTATTAPARSDHVHAHGNRGGGTLHPAATNSVAGFESAADKSKLDAADLQNFAINGAFDLWQRGTSFTTTNATGGTVVRNYTADRWYAFARKVSGAGNLSSIVSQQAFAVLAGAPGESRRALRVQRNGATAAIGFLGIAQEIDRRWVEKLRGKQVTIRFKAKAGTTLSSACKVTINTNGFAGSETEWQGTYTAGVEQQSFSPIPSSTSAFVTLNCVLTATLPTDMVGLSIMLGMDVATNAGGTGTDFIDFAEVTLTEGSTLPLQFAYAGGSYPGEIHLCRHFYEKSYLLDTAPGSVTVAGGYSANIITGSAITNGSNWPVGYAPIFRASKRVTPTMQIYGTSGAAGNLFVNGADTATTLAAISTESASFPVNNSGGSVTPTTPVVIGAWTADAEI